MDHLATMRAFVAVAEEGSFVAAAKRLGITPQLVSKHVQALESELGVRLLNRTTRSVSRTEIGDRFARRCATLLDDFEDIVTEVRDEHSQPRGHLRITVPVTFAEIYMAPILVKFSALYPDITVNMRLSDDFSDLLEESVDIALRIGKLNDSSMIVRKIVDTKSVLCAAPSYLEKAGIPKRPQDLEAHDCIVDTNRRAPDRWTFSDQGKLQTVTISGRYTVNSATASIELGKAGAGILICPDLFAQRDLAAGHLVQVLPNMTTEGSGLYALFHSARHSAAKTRVFIDFVTAWFKSHHTMPHHMGQTTRNP
ncbi:LysR family transcriptional regulator [Cognatishimia sp. SS12]|uniref:LysR family transcriptional regulator n=1 Tax=Cognatishimia sp. SS12 TaxID=2979465 RepID=UPI00232F7C93|nr:LysR family transcriptional regulator [Cognatishimia sp. SS12]MDC0739543.1 LysR family transcriptional regulator [Cognatishimia sp. SS12]